MADIYQHVTPYNYCFNNPINFSDPFGLDTIRTNDKGQSGKLAQKGDVIQGIDSKTGQEVFLPNVMVNEKDAATVKAKKSNRSTSSGFGFDGSKFLSSIYALLPTTFSIGLDADAASGVTGGGSIDFTIILKGKSAGAIYAVASGRAGVAGPISADISGHISVGNISGADVAFSQSLTAEELLNTDPAYMDGGLTQSKSGFFSVTAGAVLGGSVNFSHSQISRGPQAARYSTAGFSVGATGGISIAGGTQFSKILFKIW